MRHLLVLTTICFGLSVLAGSANAQRERSAPAPTPRTSTWSCELSAYFSGAGTGSYELKGSGMMTCRNARGFSVEQPVSGDIKISGEPTAVANRAEPIKITMESETFALIRDLNQVYAQFEPETDSSKTLTEVNSNVVLVSADRKIIIPMKISVPQGSLGKWQVERVNLISAVN